MAPAIRGFYGDVAIRGDRIVAVGRVPPGRPSARSTPTAWSSRPASSTCTRTPITCCSKTATPRARFARASPPKSSAKAAPPGRTRASCRRAAVVVARNSAMDDAGRLLRDRRKGEISRQRRLLRRPGQRLAMRDGQLARPAHGRAARTDESPGGRGDEGRRVRPVVPAGHAARLAGHHGRHRRIVQGGRPARRHLLDATSATRGPAFSMRSRKRSTSANAPASPWTSSTSRSPIRNTGAG